MLRDALLKTKRDELSKCLTSRKRKLQELYNATVSTVSQHPKSNARVHHGKGEAAFLDANNILEGRFFDLSTLQFVAEPELAYSARPPDSNLADPVSTAAAQYGDTRTFIDGNQPSILEAETAKEPEDATMGKAQSGPDLLSQPEEGFSKPPSSPKEVSTAFQESVHTADAIASLTADRANHSIASNTPNIEHGLPSPFEPSKPILSDQGSRMRTATSAPTLFPNSSLGLSKSLSSTGLRSVEAQTDITSDQYPVQELQDNVMKHLYDSSIDNTPISTDSGALRTAQSSLGSPLATPAHDDKSAVRNDFSRIPSPKRDREPSQETHKTCGPVRDGTNGVDAQSTGNDPQSLFTDTTKSESHTEQKIISTPSTPDAQFRLDLTQPLNMLPSQIKDQQASFVQPSQDINVEKGTIRSKTLPDTIANIQTSETPMIRDQTNQPDSGSDNYAGSERHTLALQERRLPGMMRNMPKDLTLSQRPPMRINTEQLSQNISATGFPKEERAKLPTPSISATPAKLVESTPNPTPPERMTTRVSSGALRHKSVSEILGETPKSLGEKGAIERASNERRDNTGEQSPRYGPLMSSPDSINFRSRLSELREREKERTKLSTVVFLRQQPSDLTRKTESALGSYIDSQDSPGEPKDYLLPLFAFKAPSQKPGLSALLNSAHKTLTTSNHYADFHQQQDCSLLTKIHTLQGVKKWPLRQPQRSIEPDRPASQWDAVLGHIKWMRTDFREERKWKMAAAKNLADWCAEWVASPPERRFSLQLLIIKRPQASRESQTNEITKNELAVDRTAEHLPLESTPELIESAEDDMSDAVEEDFPPTVVTRAVAPAAIFSLAPEDILFRLDRTPTADKLLSELPLYQPWKSSQGENLEFPSFAPDRCWKTSLVPVSKYAIGKIRSQDVVPSRKKSRYDYSDDEDESLLTAPSFLPDHIIPSDSPEQDCVALFNPENKHIRDRIHAGHAFRPPSEYNMPTQSFYECRQPSQWTWTEDDELRRLVREYAYNWSLVSSCLSSQSNFSSGAERRTPWECFERWVTLDSLPADMAKTQYFRTYFSRIEAAQRTLVAQQQAAQQQQGSSTIQLPIRRRNSQPTRVERRRNTKHLAMVHAMQKLAKRRETALQKAQHVASLAAMRKANEAAQPRQRMRTPQEFSYYKYERECKMAEKADAYRQSIIAQQQRVANAQKVNQQNNQTQAAISVPQNGRNSTSGAINGTSPHLTSSMPNGQIPISHPSQSRSLAPPQVIPNGIPPLSSSQSQNGQPGARGGQIPPAPMQPHMQGPQRVPSQMSPENMRVFLEANRLQQEQQRYLQQQQQQRQTQSQPNGQVGTLSSPPVPGNLGGTAQINNAAFTANLQASNGMPSPAISGGAGPPRSSASPRMTNSMQAQPLSSGMIPAVNQISNEIKARHPQASPEQVNKMTTDSLNHYRMVQSQAAVQAAAGNTALTRSTNGLQAPPQPPAMGGSNGPSMLDPRVYAQMMRSQQSSQQTRNGVNGIHGVRPPSRGAATPQISRNTNGQVRPSQSPRPPQEQIAGPQ